jgi:hypothetical protein
MRGRETSRPSAASLRNAARTTHSLTWSRFAIASRGGSVLPGAHAPLAINARIPFSTCCVNVPDEPPSSLNPCKKSTGFID